VDLSEDLVFGLLSSSEQFPIDFDDAWQWVGYTQKKNALRKLVNNFEKEIDYIGDSDEDSPDQQLAFADGKASWGGHNKRILFLTVDCFKSFSMMAGTKKGKEVRRYFLNCEKRLKEILEERYRNQQSQRRKTLIGSMVSEKVVSRYPKFDIEFYVMLYRKRGGEWQERSPEKRPSCVAHWTNQVVYDRLLGGTEEFSVKSTLNDVNPSINGHRKHRHHWHLKGLGEYHLNTHFEILKAVDRLTPDGDWDKFIYNVQKAIPNGEPLQLSLWEIYEAMKDDSERLS
jgi:phage anti-repressor protein